MTEREALKLALEFIDNLHKPDWGNQERQQVTTAIKEALAQPEQEPVAWLHRQGNFTEACMNPLHDDEIDRGWTQEPLYATPPQRKPLTAAEAGALWKVGMTPHAFAQAIEAAHGIKEST